MRATSPRDALVSTKGHVPIPSPKLAVGTKLDLSKVASYNKPSMLRTIRREVISRKRDTINRMRKEGYFPEMRGKKMLDCHKAQIREIFEFMETADSVEIAGHGPNEQQSHGAIANQCYIAGGSGFSAWSFSVYVLFRKQVGGQKLIYTHPEPLMCEHNATFCVIPS